MSFLINRKITPPLKPMDPVTHQGYVLGLLGITNREKQLEIWPDRDNEVWVKDFLANNWLKKDQKLVAVSFSASKRWKTKNWGMPYLVELIERLARKAGIRVVLLGAPEDKEDAIEFLRKTDAKPIDAVGKTSISQLSSLIKRCDALLTGDSAPMHVAAAVGTPYVALFGPTDPKRHIPPVGKHKVLRHKIRCSPCYKSTCMKKTRCMTMIRPEEVFGALMEIVEQGSKDKVQRSGARSRQ